MDTGGTFTDLVLFADDTGELFTWKILSTPHDPSEAVCRGILELLAQRNLLPADIAYLGHGTTVATNAFLEGKGAITGLLTTQGFEDLLEIGRQARPHLYDLHADKHPSLVPGRRRVGIPERIDFQGQIVTPLDEAAAREAIKKLQRQGTQAIAICFLHSWVNPQHERRMQTLVEEEFPEAYVATSSEVLREIREYERLSTTVLSAYLGPVVVRYLNRLQQRLKEIGFRVAPQITQSNGGIMSLQAAERRAVETALSGPASGVIGAA
ncbi:MAG: hydantoinase/oxoprolinase family protein, partial [Nitrospinota bacterium]